MEAAVSLHCHRAAGPLPLPAALPPPHLHHRAGTLPLHPRRHSLAAASAKPPPAARPSTSTSTARSPVAAAAVSSSSRAATGYAAALADACARAGTLPRAARHARDLLRFPGRHNRPSESDDARVAALVRMLVAKGKTGMLAEVMAEFAAICHHLLPTPARPRQAY